MEKEKYNKKFSIAHWDSCKDDNIFLKTFEGSSEQWKKERYDIYFGTKFIHQDVTYGETMGEQATPGQYRNFYSHCPLFCPALENLFFQSESY